VILATNPTLEGEATAMYLAERPRGRRRVVSRIARGLPVGGDLEYADEVTLIRASRAGAQSEPAMSNPRLRDPAPPGQGRRGRRRRAVIYGVLVGPLGATPTRSFFSCRAERRRFILLSRRADLTSAGGLVDGSEIARLTRAPAAHTIRDRAASQGAERRAGHRFGASPGLTLRRQRPIIVGLRRGLSCPGRCTLTSEE